MQSLHACLGKGEGNSQMLELNFVSDWKRQPKCRFLRVRKEWLFEFVWLRLQVTAMSPDVARHRIDLCNAAVWRDEADRLAASAD